MFEIIFPAALAVATLSSTLASTPDSGLSERPPVKPAYAQASTAGCTVENMTTRSEYGYFTISGTTSCSQGLMSYSIGENGSFVTSGYAGVHGFVFQIMEPVDILQGDGSGLSLSYVIEAN